MEVFTSAFSIFNNLWHFKKVMQKILSSEEMREVDRLTTEKYGIPSLLLMENAAHAAARAILEKSGGSVTDRSVLVLCGKGNNGGDGAALARILWTLGADVEVCLFGKVEETKGDARTNFEVLQKISDKEVFELAQPDLAFEEINNLDEWLEYESLNFHHDDPEIIVDALFGTGLTRPLEELYEHVAGYVFAFNVDGSEQENLVVSLDVPSGINADGCERDGMSPRAHLTVTFTAPKIANIFPPASHFGGELVTAHIGSPCELLENSPSQTFLAEKCDAVNWICKTQVRRDSYKKTRGTALIVAGSKNYSGAAILAANGCFAAGAGMVSVAVPDSIQRTVAAKVSEEIITRGFSETKNGSFNKSAVKDILKASEKTHVVALGCGLSTDDGTADFVQETVKKRKTPVLLDADGLNALAPFKIKGSDELPIVLTPHIGEFQRLAGAKKEIKNRIEAARAFAAKHNVILLLKGEKSLTAAPDGRVVINPTGNAGVARAGAGDTLTGIIAAFLAQTYGLREPNLENTFEAVVAALYVAGLAGDIAAEKFGCRLMTATDVRECLDDALFKVCQDG